MKGKFFKNVGFGEALTLKGEVEYADGQVVSKTLVQTENISITLFAFDKGEGISSHSAPGDAMVYVTEGEVTIHVGENEPVIVKEGEFIIMPANIPHALQAHEKFKMNLVVVKG
ncbi:cupin domain-containing protein [Clostridium sporogenes]|uniref:Cupin domain-containing protein n=1 Tax=Clostridium botulinum TaxID=1491 RepID=A0A6M0SXY1_CLOBO|nr:cupin domain-containing protein [Clostridium sporogenes]NFA59785.1 cupin domain-containing protein [Clostridium botulinum]NFI72137.1 cupin domain-containing protein [Clostridium sporogenes]NFL72558.1 cupin domain-containing protein [Clostridium sporogenes]NFM23675.1 cupin domain-containing protein [Clostridium sporogenes]NFP61015.1 cupin domain-containing protein [Clostridium sporogenes]